MKTIKEAFNTTNCSSENAANKTNVEIKFAEIYVNVHGSTNFKCLLCSNSFYQFNHFLNHLQLHDEHLYNCYLCEQSFKDFPSTFNHLITIHYTPTKSTKENDFEIDNLSIDTIAETVEILENEYPNDNDAAITDVVSNFETIEMDSNTKETKNDKRDNAAKTNIHNLVDALEAPNENSLNIETSSIDDVEELIEVDDMPGTCKSSATYTHTMCEKSPIQQEFTEETVTRSQRNTRRNSVKLKKNIVNESSSEVSEENNDNVREQLKSIRKKRVRSKQPVVYLDQCNICGKMFRSGKDLKAHLIIHTMNRPYKCKICGNGFSHPSTLTKHMITHSTERPYLCNICAKSYARSELLNSHMRRHTGEKPHVCKICDRKFYDRKHLVVHHRIHTGVKPYSCTVCNKPFRTSGAMHVHRKTHTNENNESKKNDTSIKTENVM